MAVPKVGNQICSWQSTKQLDFKKVLQMATVIALVMLVGYVFYKAVKRNKVEEKCIKQFDPTQCAHALGNTVRETAQTVGPFLASCKNPISPTCYLAMGKVFVHELGNLP